MPTIGKAALPGGLFIYKNIRRQCRLDELYVLINGEIAQLARACDS